MAGTAAFIDVLPNLNGFGGKLVSGAQSQVANAGTRLGDAMAKSMNAAASKNGTDGIVANLETAEKKAKNAVKQATKEIGQARDQQRVAAMNLQAAERKLDETVLKNGRNSSQAIKASAQLESARSKARTATSRLSDAENTLREAQNAAKETTTQLKDAQEKAASTETKRVGILERLRNAYGATADAGGELAGKSKLSAGAIGMIGGVASQISGRVIDAFSGIGSQITEASDATDKFKQTLGFAGIGGKDIDKLTKQTQKYADQTVYDLADIQNTTAQLAANGVPNYEKLAEAAGNLNAVAGGNAETYKSVAMMLTQTAGAGKLTTENWNQLADAIPGASGKLQEAMRANGAYTGNFRDALADGQITADEFNKAIMQLGTQDVAKQAATSTSTIEGAWGNLQASITGVGTQLLNTVKPQITGVMSGIGDAVTNGFAWLQSNGPALIPVIAGIGAGFATWAAGSIIVSVTGWIQGLSAAITAAGGAVKFLTAAVSANPLGLIITGVALAVTALTWFFTQTETGRRAWSAFTGFLAGAWNIVWPALQSGFQWVVSGLQALGTALSWLWTSIISPTLGFIKTAFQLAMTILGTVFFTPFQLALNLLGTVFNWLYTNVFQPVWAAIQSSFNTAWNWINLNVITPFKTALNLLGTVFNWLYANIVVPVWNGIQSAISAVWNWLSTNVIDPFKRGIDNLGKAMQGMKDMAVKAWDSLKDAAAKPVRWIVDVVYTNGIQKVWNGIANAVGLDLKLPDAQFAAGGINPGYAPGHDSILALTSPGEAWMVPEWVRAVGAGNIHRWNRMARSQAAVLVRRDMGMQAYKDGGIVGKAKQAISGIADAIGSFVADPGAFITSRILDPVRSMVASIGSGSWGQLVAQLPVKVASGLIDKAKSMVGKLFTPADTAQGGPVSWQGGAGVEQWRPLVLKALNMLGQPATWADTVLRRMNQESGGNPNAVNNWDSNAAAGIPSQGLMQTIPPTFNAYAGPFTSKGILDPMANIYAGINYSIHRYGSIAGMNRPGGYSTGGIVPTRTALYDKGGWLPQGRTLVENRTGAPELVLNPEQAKTYRQDSRNVEYKPTYIIQGLTWDDVEAKITARNRHDMAPDI